MILESFLLDSLIIMILMVHVHDFFNLQQAYLSLCLFSRPIPLFSEVGMGMQLRLSHRLDINNNINTVGQNTHFYFIRFYYHPLHVLE